MSECLQQRTDRKVSSGKFYPLGATLADEGVNFAIYSQRASAVYLLLFDRADGEPTDIIRLECKSRHIWHGFVHGLKAGQLYGYKVQGEFNPVRGLRFNEHKLLIDPCAKAFTGKLRNTDNLLLAYDPRSPLKDLSLDTRDNSRIVPKSVVIDDRFDWDGDALPEIPLEKTIFYEVHLKGFTAHPSARVAQPGTYLGFVEKIPYLRELGITAVEFLPIHEFYVDDFLWEKELTNYWGYNTIGFFAPESSYASSKVPGAQVTEFKTLVRELHKAGIEAILDVVYNHTGEGNELGPTFGFKGIDNPTYYSLCGGPDDPSRYYMNHTGCGNTVNFDNPQVIAFVMNSLRYWVEIMHVDGFRFDLASVLGREEGRFRHSASFFDAAAQDPVLSRVKLIAEPWDLGAYEVGNFPVEWSEWNGRFRDTARRFTKGDSGQCGDMARRLTGSADLYADDGRTPSNSINFVTCHDGFTLYDLVSYSHKHNESNRENNRDGANDNHSWNWGAEGETKDSSVLALREQLAKNYVCALLFAAGTPMLLGGDEFLRSQKGNNNAYCQDNDISWFNWDEAVRHAGFLDFVKKAIALTKRCNVLQRRKFFFGKDINSDGVSDIRWYGTDLGPPRWDDPELRTLCYQLDGGEEKSEFGSYRLFLILNADHRAQDVLLPSSSVGRWRRILDTSLENGNDFADAGREIVLVHLDRYRANPRSTVLLISKTE